MLALDVALDFDPALDDSFFASLPERPGVFLIELRSPSSSAPGAPPAKPYLSRTADLRRTAERLLRAPDGLSKRLNLRSLAQKFRYRATASRFEQSLALYQHARQQLPGGYRAHLRLRPPALLKINLRNSYPRCYVTRRILSDGGYYFGPFPSRKNAESFSSGFLDLFKIRRCQIKIRRDPAFPGCIYSEMKMCLAPCFAGCTKDEYAAEAARVVETLESKGASLTREIEREREAASGLLDFEKAASLHKKVEKVSGVLRNLPEIARRIDNLDAVVIQRASGENSVALFRVSGGFIDDPFFLRFDDFSSQPRSVEELVRQKFSAASEIRDVPGEISAREEHLALLARWYYSNPRDGEILFREGDWPYRRILRACARVLAAGKPAEPESKG